MSDRGDSPPPAVSDDERLALGALYRCVDDATARFQGAHPAARCPAGCHRCCTRAAPLVSDVEFARVEIALRGLDCVTRDRVRARSLALRAELEQGEPDDFACPLLDAGRCLVYAERPYLCRSFGHSARRVEGDLVKPYTCEVLLDAVRAAQPPLLDARIAALRALCGRCVDSYLPIWLSTAPAERVARWPAADRAVVVATNAARLDAQSP